MKRLAGKVVFITGAGRGQGRSHAVRFAREGADVVGVDLCENLDVCEYPLANPEDLSETAEMVAALGQRMVAVKADVRDADALAAAYKEGLSAFGQIDCVLANAGICPMFGEAAEAFEAYQTSIDIMMTGVMNTVRTAIPHMVDAGNGGAIVITSSTGGSPGGVVHNLAMASYGMVGYVAAKHGIVGMMRIYASALAPHNIRVNSVHPTGVNTPMIVNESFPRYLEAHPEASVYMDKNRLPVELIDPEDVSATMAYLCSDDARFVTGTTVHVDAGFTM